MMDGRSLRCTERPRCYVMIIKIIIKAGQREANTNPSQTAESRHFTPKISAEDVSTSATGKEAKENLSHKTEEIRAAQSINDADQGLMLSLRRRQLARHSSRIRRDKVALRHLQLTLLGLDVGTCRLQPAQ
jgi:hypothetical protein